jgi:hypothetical protein
VRNQHLLMASRKHGERRKYTGANTLGLIRAKVSRKRDTPLTSSPGGA